MPRINGVDALAACLAAQFLDESLSDAIDAANGRHYPYLITHANVAVLADITIKGSVVVLDVKFFVDRTICVLERTRQIGLEIVLIHPIASLQILLGVADGITVFDDVSTLWRILDQHFMPCGRVLINDNLTAIDIDDVTLFFRLQTDYDRVCRIDFQKCSLFHIACICSS